MGRTRLMARRVEWCCDGCGDVTDSAGSTPPPRWHNFHVEISDGSPQKLIRESYDLCDACSARLLDGINPHNWSKPGQAQPESLSETGLVKRWAHVHLVEARRSGGRMLVPVNGWPSSKMVQASFHSWASKTLPSGTRLPAPREIWRLAKELPCVDRLAVINGINRIVGCAVVDTPLDDGDVI
jgi:hypothetical protein